jgi:DNA topoisomerase VI subunit B
VVLKELVDNALDACEKADVSPVIGIEVHGTHSGGIEISVSDNGPGIPTKTVESVLNFDTRTSDNAAYRSPSRGAQGNARVCSVDSRAISWIAAQKRHTRRGVL